MQKITRNYTIPENVHKWIIAQSRAENRSVAGQVADILQEAYENRAKA